jgi:CRP/FNR family cyclic AMP-dependent transcriptional regulator
MSDTAPAKSDCVDFLGLLKEPKRRQVLAGSRHTAYPAGATAYAAGSPDFAVIIERGLVRVYVGSPTGRQATVFYRHNGELLGVGLIKRPAIEVYVQTVTEADVTSLDLNWLRALAARDAEVSGALLIYYSNVVAHATGIIAVRSLGGITERLAFDLLDRACANQLASGRLVVRASQQQLADSIGSVREVVARSLRKLKDERVVSTAPNLVRVLDVERLEEIATQRVNPV